MAENQVQTLQTEKVINLLTFLIQSYKNEMDSPQNLETLFNESYMSLLFDKKVLTTPPEIYWKTLEGGKNEEMCIDSDRQRIICG